MKLLSIIAFFCLQPLLWIGIVRTYLNYSHRIKKERKLFTTSIYIDFFEGRHFLRSGLILGLLGSLICMLIGMTLPIKLILMYEMIAAILLLIGQVLGFTSALISILALIIFNTLAFLDPIENFLHNLGIDYEPVTRFNASMLAFLTIITLLTGLFMKQNGGKFPSPKITYNKRHKKVAEYPFNELTILPLVTLVPGDWFNSFKYWPVININEHRFAILVVPILIGYKLIVKHSDPVAYFKSLSNGLLQTSLIGLLGVLGSFVNEKIAVFALALMVINYARVWLVSHHRDNKMDFDYGQVIDGVRIIAIQPNTPAAKMNLMIGDVIIEVNHQKVNNENELYRALSTNSTYCYLKVRDRNNQLKITETAIFKDSPNELGIETFIDNN